jgi:hypothetical protein
MVLPWGLVLQHVSNQHFLMIHPGNLFFLYPQNQEKYTSVTTERLVSIDHCVNTHIDTYL